MLPREKLLQLGVESLTLSELFSVVLGSGTSKQNVFEISDAVTSSENFRKIFLDKRVEYWTQIPGIGVTKAARLVASMELVQRILHPKHECTKIQSSKDVFEHLRSRVVGKTNESFYVLCLDSKNRVVFENEVHVGFRDFVLTDMKEIFASILLSGAKSFICAHNHPSQDIQPSSEDRELTRKIYESSKILDLRFLDHVIVTSQAFYSFFENEAELFA